MTKKYSFGIIGISPGNGHPYSWAAIFNGCDRERMAKCPFPVIAEYLGKQDPDTIVHSWSKPEKTPMWGHTVAG